MRSARIDNILAKGRLLFPQNEYGYSSWFKMPGIIISPLREQRLMKLALIGSVQREMRDGRYYPGFDCFEASYWLKDQVHHEGGKSRDVWVQNPLYPRDIGIEVDGKLLSLTPQIDPASPFVKVKSALPEGMVEDIWKLREFPCLIDLSGITLFGETMEGPYMNHALFIGVKRNKLEIAISSCLLDKGFPTKKAEISFTAPLSDIFSIIRLWKGGNIQQALLRFRPHSFPASITFLAWINRKVFVPKFYGLSKTEIPKDPTKAGKTFLKKRNTELAYKYLSVVIGLLDIQWAKLFVR